MPSFDSDWLSFAGLIVLCVSYWRFTTVMSRMAQSGGRGEERREQQRDRLLQIMIEKKQVDDSPEHALRMAGMHANEAQRNQTEQLRRDHAADPSILARQVRAAKREAAHRVPPELTGSEKDAMS